MGGHEAGGVDAFIDTFGSGYVDLAIEVGAATERMDTIADREAQPAPAPRRTGARLDEREVLAELGTMRRGCYGARAVTSAPLLSSARHLGTLTWTFLCRQPQRGSNPCFHFERVIRAPDHRTASASDLP